MVSKWMGDCYVLGFVSALRIVLWSKILCRLCKSPSDETKLRSPVSIRMHDPVVHTPCQSLLDYGNNKITEHGLKLVKVSVFIMLKLDTIRKRKNINSCHKQRLKCPLHGSHGGYTGHICVLD